MKCPKCTFEQPEGQPACGRCGLIFAKFREPAERVDTPQVALVNAPVNGFLAHLTAVDPAESHLVLAGRSVLLVLMLVWGWRFSTASIASGYAFDTPLHLIHLPFHEAGHVIFGLFGMRFVTVLGGTLGQLLVPIAIIVAFLGRRNPFGGSVGLWWLGQSFMDAAVYADDARAGQLPLIGGVTGSEVEDYHDWEVMLGKLGWLSYDHLIARWLYGIGIVLVLLALVWGGFLVWQQTKLLCASRRTD